MPEVIIKLVVDGSIEDVLTFKTKEEAIKKAIRINKFLDRNKYYMERVK